MQRIVVNIIIEHDDGEDANLDSRSKGFGSASNSMQPPRLEGVPHALRVLQGSIRLRNRQPFATP
jgi:hypothetical protein